MGDLLGNAVELAKGHGATVDHVTADLVTLCWGLTGYGPGEM